MGFLKRLFGPGGDAPKSPSPEHALLVYLELSDGEFGAPDERASIQALADRLERAIEEAGVGEFDGDEFGQGECTLFMYGPECDRLFATIEPIIRASPHSAGGHAIKRYGPAQDSSAREVRVDL